MPTRYFNWKLAIVLILGFMVLIVTAFGLRRWQRFRRADRGLVLGNKAYEEHRWQDAAKYLGRYVAVQRDDVSALLKYADAQLNIRPIKSGNIQQAIEAYRTVLRVDKVNSEAATRLAQLYLDLDMPGEAELVVTKQLQVSTGLPPGHKDLMEPDTKSDLQRMRAVAMAKQRKFGPAAEELTEIIEKNPGYIPAYETLGWLCQQRPEDFPGSAAQWFDKAVENNPSDALAYIVRASFRIRNKQVGDALADLERAEKLDLSDHMVRLRLAQELLTANDLERAQKHLEVVRQAEAKNLDLWKTWAELARRSGSKATMARIAEDALRELSSQSWDFMPLATELLITAEQYERAGDCITQMVQGGAGNKQVEFLKGLLADREGKLSEAVAHYRRALETGNKAPQTRLLLASVLSRLGDRQSAVSQLRTLVTDQPQFVQGRLALLRLLIKTSKWAEAAEHALIGCRTFPENSEFHLMYVRSQLGLLATRRTEATPSLWSDLDQRLLRLEQATDEALPVKLVRFQFLLLQTRFEEAESLISELKRSYPDRVRLDLAQVEILLARQSEDEAIALLTDAINKFPDATEPVRYLAALSARRGDRQMCEEVVKAALARINEPAAIRELGLLLAQFYRQWEDKESEYRLLSKLTERLPNDIPLMRQLLKCERVRADAQAARNLIERIRGIEGEQGWQWRYEQARLWYEASDFDASYHQIVSLLQENLLSNPDDQASRLLLGATYERAGELRLAISTYTEALGRAPDDVRIIVPTVAALYKANEYQRADEILRRAAAQDVSDPELTRLQLQSYLRHGQLDPAGAILEQMVADDPENTSVALSLVLLRMQQGHLNEAERLLKELKASEPDSLQMRAAEIELNVRRGQHRQALLLCDAAVHDFNNAPAYMLRAGVLARLGENDRAMADFEKAAAVEPENAQAWLARSDFCRVLGRFEEAVASVETAMLLAPDNLRIRKHAISLLAASSNRQQKSRAKALLEQALSSKPDDPELELLNARMLLANGTGPDIRKAVGILEAITERQPQIADAWVLLGQVLLNQGDAGRAVDVALRGLVHRPNYKPLFLLKARAEAARSPALAVQTLRALHELDPRDADSLLRLAKVQISAGEADKAVNLLREQLKADTSDRQRRRIEIQLAMALHKSGDKAKARSKLDALYESEPNDPAVLLAEVRLLNDDGLWGQLGQTVAGWFQAHPGQTQVLMTIANELAATEEPEAKDTAEYLLRMLLEHHPDFSPAMNTLALVLQTTGRFEESAALYERILAMEPNNVIAVNNLAWILCEEQGQYRKALDLSLRGLEMAPEYVDLIDTCAVTYLRLGQYDKAIQELTRCLELCPANSPTASCAHLHLAQALASVGRKSQADANLKKALDLNGRVGGLSSAEVAEAQQLIKELQEGP